MDLALDVRGGRFGGTLLAAMRGVGENKLQARRIHKGDASRKGLIRTFGVAGAKSQKKCQAFYTRLLCISLDINDLTGFVFTQLATRKGWAAASTTLGCSAGRKSLSGRLRTRLSR